MSSSTRRGYAFLAVGLVLCLSVVMFGGSTQRACPGIQSPVYEMVGVHPAGFDLMGIDLASLELSWYDGCNRRSNSLIPLILGIGSLVAGVATVRR